MFDERQPTNDDQRRRAGDDQIAADFGKRPFHEENFLAG
jgi:hypothetical protein